jgi:hypothetical protein
MPDLILIVLFLLSVLSLVVYLWRSERHSTQRRSR